MKKEIENGYEYTNRLFKKIQKDSKHLLPVEESIDYIKFYGLEELLNNAQGRIRFVGRVAIKSIINDAAKRREIQPKTGMTNKEMTIDEARNTLKSLKQYYNDKNEDSYVGFDNEDNEALDMASRALEVVQGMEEVFLKALPELDMREATDEERSSLKHYIDSISQPTGITIDNVQDYREPDFNVKEWLSSFNTESATVCFTAVQELKKRLEV